MQNANGNSVDELDVRARRLLDQRPFPAFLQLWQTNRRASTQGHFVGFEPLLCDNDDDVASRDVAQWARHFRWNISIIETFFPFNFWRTKNE